MLERSAEKLHAQNLKMSVKLEELQMKYEPGRFLWPNFMQATDPHMSAERVAGLLGLGTLFSGT